MTGKKKVPWVIIGVVVVIMAAIAIYAVTPSPTADLVWTIQCEGGVAVSGTREDGKVAGERELRRATPFCAGAEEAPEGWDIG